MYKSVRIHKQNNSRTVRISGILTYKKGTKVIIRHEIKKGDEEDMNSCLPPNLTIGVINVCSNYQIAPSCPPQITLCIIGQIGMGLSLY